MLLATEWQSQTPHSHPCYQQTPNTHSNYWQLTISTLVATTNAVIVDRYSHWPVVFRAEQDCTGSKGLISHLRLMFSTFGVPEEIASDGASEFASSETQNFLKTWQVHHRLSSVAFPHSNCRAEIAVKQVKRIITDNCSPSGSIQHHLQHTGPPPTEQPLDSHHGGQDASDPPTSSTMQHTHTP